MARRMKTGYTGVLAVLVGLAVPLAVAGPDVVTFRVHDVAYWGSSGGIDAYSLGTTSCNRGDQDLNWIAGTPDTPVIAQNLYRIKDGRLEQLGMSWLKWAFASLNQSSCGACQDPGTSQRLGPNCSDPYSAGLNGSQSGLGPRSVVNPFTGFHPGSHATPSGPSTIAGRIQVPVGDMDPAQNAGATYLGECHYVAPDDAAANNLYNNVSVRQVWVTSSHALTFSNPLGGQSSTLESVTAIEAWQLLDPSVALTFFNLPNDGRVYLAWKATQAAGGSADFNGDGQTDVSDLGVLLANFGMTGATFADGDADGDGDVDVSDLGVVLAEFGSTGTYHYEFAIYNMNADRAIQAVTVALPNGSTASNIGFKDVDYHSGEPYSTTDWTATSDANSVSWATETFAQNPNANALRWGTMYNYWFDADVTPDQMTTVTLDIFKQDAVNTKVVNLPAVQSNDDCANAYKLLNPTVFFNTIGATTDGPDEPGACTSGGFTQIDNDVWFRYNGACNGTGNVTVNADYDAKVAVYAGGCPGSGGTFVACDDTGSGNLSVNFSVTDGEVYYIRVGGRFGATGTGELSVSCN